VTNCTKHVGGRAIAEARLTAEGLEVAVRDEGQLPVIPRQPAAGDENGRGLLIVESLSARARVEYFAGGKRVSALLSHAGRAASR
jgi:anti-sigma regulatory factor (Ser/Thr protein kinase)